MKPGQYIISVQWGSGMHYLNTTHAKTAEEAIKEALFVCRDLKDRVRRQNPGGRGAKPTVYVWQQLKSLDPGELLA
jgi:hypothetical protein